MPVMPGIRQVMVRISDLTSSGSPAQSLGLMSPPTVVGRSYSLIAPFTRPDTRYREKKSVKMIAGRIDTTAAADSWFQKM